MDILSAARHQRPGPLLRVLHRFCDPAWRWPSPAATPTASSRARSIQQATPSSGARPPKRGAPSDGKGGRVMSFAACGGKLYASVYNAIVVRTDGANPVGRFYRYSGPALTSRSSGFRGLTCVPNLNGSGSMLIASLEGTGDIYDIPLDGSQPTIELHIPTISPLSWAPGLGTSLPRTTIWSSTLNPDRQAARPSHWSRGRSTANYPNAYQGFYPTPSFLVRHCNGVYGYFGTH